MLCYPPHFKHPEHGQLLDNFQRFRTIVSLLFISASSPFLLFVATPRQCKATVSFPLPPGSAGSPTTLQPLPCSPPNNPFLAICSRSPAFLELPHRLACSGVAPCVLFYGGAPASVSLSKHNRLVICSNRLTSRGASHLRRWGRPYASSTASAKRSRITSAPS